MDDDEVRITLRMPTRLRDQLAGAAEESARSMNGEIVSRLEGSFTLPRTEILYVLLDADGHPTSWPEITTHLAQIAAAGGFNPVTVQGQIFNTQLTSSSKREENWFDLVDYYRQKRGLPLPSDD